MVMLSLKTMLLATVNWTSDGYTVLKPLMMITKDFDKVENYGLNLEWQLTENLSANLDVSLSKASSNFRNGLLWALVMKMLMLIRRC